MVFRRSSGGGLDRAVTALAAAGGVAHLVFLSLFGWRMLSGGGFLRYVNLIFAALAAVGFGLNFVGYSIVKYGGRTRARKIGIWAIALSTALAGVLLFAASWTG
jgi:hypothetical protein